MLAMTTFHFLALGTLALVYLAPVTLALRSA